MRGRSATSVRGVSLLWGVALLVALAASSSAQAVTVESEEKLTASDAASGDQFAWSVAVSGDRVVVGAPSDDDLGSDSGSVYVLEPDGAGGWSETHLTASDGAANDFFGAAVAVSGGRVVVGAQLDDDLGSDSGSVYVFEPDGAGGWSKTKLTASDGAANDQFGASVAVSGDRVVVGAPFDDDLGFSSGSGYVLEPDGAGGWSESKLTASDGAALDFFGYSVAVSGDRVVVGAVADDDLGSDAGSAYVFEPDGAGGWSGTKVTASDGAALDFFGFSVAVSGDRVVMGARGDDDLVSNSGSAYVFGLTPVDADGDGVADASDVCAGTDLTEPAPAELKKNRYWTAADGGFIDATGKLSPYTIADTAGCSASQVIQAAGLGSGHLRFGITASALAAWVAAR